MFVSWLRQSCSRFGVYRLIERCAAGVPSLTGRIFTPHVIRHTCAFGLLRSGVNLNTIRAWLGHLKLVIQAPEVGQFWIEINIEMKQNAMELCDTSTRASTKSWKRNTDHYVIPASALSTINYVV